MCLLHCSEISSQRSGELSYTVPKLNPKDKIRENLPLVSSVLYRNFDSVFVLGLVRRFASTVGHIEVLVGCATDLNVRTKNSRQGAFYGAGTQAPCLFLRYF